MTRELTAPQQDMVRWAREWAQKQPGQTPEVVHVLNLLDTVDALLQPSSAPEVETEDYRNAPSGVGPHASTWEDKPHRLVYDLCNEVQRLRLILAAQASVK